MDNAGHSEAVSKQQPASFLKQPIKKAHFDHRLPIRLFTPSSALQRLPGSERQSNPRPFKNQTNQS
jgi:hypothetical protein